MQNNTLSRSELDTAGKVLNIHYGDVLIKYGSVLDASDQTIPYIVPGNESPNYVHLQDGDVVIADTAEDEAVGKTTEIYNVLGSKIEAGLHTIPCRPIIPFAPKYLGYYMNTPCYHKQLIPLMQGIKVLSVSKGNISKTKISAPNSLEEQEKISSLLYLLDQRAAIQSKIIEALKKYKRGAVSRLLNGTLAFNGFSDIESWQLKRVGDFCEVQMCKRVFKEQTTPNGDVPFYKIGTIGGLPDAYISRSLYEEYKRKYSFPRKGEFLISCAGTVGKCVPYNGEDSYYQDSNIVWLRNNSQDVSNEYLYLLISNVDWGTLNSTTITRIYNDNLRELSFYIPSMQMQKRIAEYIFALSKRIDSEQAMLEKLQQEKLGLLQQLFI